MIFKIAVIGISGAILGLLVGQFHREYSTVIILAVCIFIMLVLTENVGEIISFMQEIGNQIHIGDAYLKLLFKLLAIAYVSQTSSSICSDLGYQSISFQIEAIGKIAVLTLSLPVIRTILETVEEIMCSGG